jgi:hypothetical protein
VTRKNSENTREKRCFRAKIAFDTIPFIVI